MTKNGRLTTFSEGSRRLPDRPGRRSQARNGLFGFVLGLLGSVLLCGFFITLGGFLEFTSSLPRTTPKEVSGDAIVVLTGGDDRIAAGISLLASGRSNRMLISGVNGQIGREDIRELIDPLLRDYFDCCVELGMQAQNTIGNAQETAIWIEDNDIDTIILVTAFYHMPRSLVEMRNADPEVSIVPYPVFPEGVYVEHWWRGPGSARLLATEYLKYVAALMRFRLNLT
jgi:uncharacterized SAM-binding protein YcdF (DUF218 family)